MTDEGSEALREHILQNTRGATEKMESGNLHSAFDELLVGVRLARMALGTDPEYLTPERVELTARMAWAEAELEHGHGARAKDDLEHVDDLAEAVYNDRLSG